MKHKKGILVGIIISIVFLLVIGGYVIQQYLFKCTKESCSIKMEEEYQEVNQKDTNLKTKNK